MMPYSLMLTLLVAWTGASVKVPSPCDQNTFHSSVHSCRSNFNQSMETSGYQEKCPWPDVKLIYYNLKMCVDASAQQSFCSGYKFTVDEIFMEVHKTYFSLCSGNHDPPLHTLLMLIAPCVIMTLFLPFLCVHLTPLNKQ